jgi:hypothetical protein
VHHKGKACRNITELNSASVTGCYVCAQLRNRRALTPQYTLTHNCKGTPVSACNQTLLSSTAQVPPSTQLHAHIHDAAAEPRHVSRSTPCVSCMTCMRTWRV